MSASGPRRDHEGPRWPRVLLTGRPGVGKTTAAIRTVGRLRDAGVTVGGFYTEEVRSSDGRRRGFDIVRLDGQRGPLARVGLDSTVSVGRYGVDVDEVARRAIPSLEDEAEVIVVDEIAPMELACPGFADAVVALFDRPVAVLATVHHRGDAFTDRLEAQSDIDLIEVTTANRDDLPADLARSLSP